MEVQMVGGLESGLVAMMGLWGFERGSGRRGHWGFLLEIACGILENLKSVFVEEKPGASKKYSMNLFRLLKSDGEEAVAERRYGLQTAKAAIRFINQREDVPYNEADIVCLDSRSSAYEHRQQNEQILWERRDGWVEIKMGEFMNEQGDDGEVEARLIETQEAAGLKAAWWQGGNRDIDQKPAMHLDVVIDNNVNSFRWRERGGWVEIKMGNPMDQGDDSEVEAPVFENTVVATGLIVEVREFRPKGEACV
ncbi:hypothetical protein RJ639_002963 [Escallonia herrerae]|uniref:Uncharacterized protein n=1 Tax=Escallonia herrerae TaxID=1293975 RepID=A0AA88W113_9ASTE|nr:hypothetical protein RJ639_002963 [Escallonia herrerae]